jgi:DNA-directed RNA polymerase specialized sigma24 family protein
MGTHHAISIWFRFNRKLDLDDLKSQAALLGLSGISGRALWCDLFDYAEREHRRRPVHFRHNHQCSYSWNPLHLGVRVAVNKLPTRQRQAILLVFFSDYKRVEAAKEMRITKGAVTHLMHKAFYTLRQELS